MATAYLGWSGDVKTKRSQRAPTKRQVWTVTDALTEDEAYSASGMPDIDDELSPGSEFRVSNMRAYHGPDHGPTTWLVDVDFDVPADGTFDPYSNPLDRPYELTWGVGMRTVVMEQDYTGKLAQNSAGDFFDPLPTRDIPVDTLRITKWFTTYDRTLARLVRNKLNNTQFTVAGTQVLPYEALCVSILPVASYTTKSRYVQVAFEFELATEFRALANPEESGYPFDSHIVDKGQRGWYSDSGTIKKGFFCVSTGTGGAKRAVQILSDDVLLDGTGKPIDSNILVADMQDATGAKVFDPVANPNAAQHMTTDYESPFSAAGTPTVNSPKVWLLARVGEANFGVLPFTSGT